jgi:hypothetical protein
MQNDRNANQLTGAIAHPGEPDWMDFLYEEVSPSRKREMEEHLRNCSSCAGQVRAWRGGMDALNAYRLPVTGTHRKRRFAPILRWTTAAAAILAIGFLLGRVSSGSERQIRELQASVVRLEQASTDSAVQAASEHTVRLLNEYTRMANVQKAQETQATALALRTLEEEYLRLRSGLEILAVNTEDGLQMTHQNLARLAAYSTSSMGK